MLIFSLKEYNINKYKKYKTIAIPLINKNKYFQYIWVAIKKDKTIAIPLIKTIKINIFNIFGIFLIERI